jgi:predicted nucleic acid-binding protein
VLRAVLDANVVASRLINPQGVPAEVLLRVHAASANPMDYKLASLLSRRQHSH